MTTPQVKGHEAQKMTQHYFSFKWEFVSVVIFGHNTHDHLTLIYIFSVLSKGANVCRPFQTVFLQLGGDTTRYPANCRTSAFELLLHHVVLTISNLSFQFHGISKADGALSKTGRASLKAAWSEDPVGKVLVVLLYVFRSFAVSQQGFFQCMALEVHHLGFVSYCRCFHVHHLEHLTSTRSTRCIICNNQPLHRNWGEFDTQANFENLVENGWGWEIIVELGRDRIFWHQM